MNIKSFVFLCFLIPVCFLVLLEIKEAVELQSTVSQAEHDIHTNSIIGRSRALDNAMRRVFFDGLLHISDLSHTHTDEQYKDQAEKALKSILAWFQREGIGLPQAVVESINNLVAHYDLIEGDVYIEQKEWFNVYLDASTALYGFSLALLKPSSTDRLALYLQIALRDKLQRLELSLIEESFLINQAINEGVLSDTLVAELGFVRAQSEIERRHIRSINEQFSKEVTQQNKVLDSLHEAILTFEKALDQADDARRKIYANILLEESLIQPDDWKQEVSELLVLLE